MNALLDEETLARLREASAGHGVRLLCLFGSQATGRAGPESDLDIGAWFDDVARAQAAERPFFAAVVGALAPDAPALDLVVLDLADPLLQYLVASEGQPLFEADAIAFAEFSIRAAAAYADTEKYRRGLHEWLQDYAARTAARS